MAAVQAEEDRKAKAAAEAEARRKSEEAEQQRLAALRARHSALLSQSHTEISKGDYDRAIAIASEAMQLDPKRSRVYQPGHRLFEKRRQRPSHRGFQ